MFLTPGVKHKQCRFNPVRVRDLASGRLLNGSEQTAGAGEQTELQHQKTEDVNPGWPTYGEVTQLGNLHHSKDPDVDCWKLVSFKY